MHLRDFTKSYSGWIGFAAFSFSLYRGELLGSVEESGSGKSTLLNSVVGRLPPDSGMVISDTCAEGQRDMPAMAELKRRILGYGD